jgi:hypothetical protein
VVACGMGRASPEAIAMGCAGERWGAVVSAGRAKICC